MVTSYYIMKMTMNRKSNNTEEYYNSLQRDNRLNVHNKQLKCRVCLQDGVISISSVENMLKIKEALKFFGDIEINENDENPKRLCNVCYKFLKSAILFRQIAQRTNETLKLPLQVESREHFHDDSGTYEKDKSIENSLSDDFLLQKLPKGPKIQCPTCKKLFTRSYYKIHLTMHNPNHINQYVCDTCGKSFRLRVSYYKHRLRHRTDYSYNCQLCPFKGRYDESLKRHMRSHIRDYKYMCTECPARFLYKSNLNYHILVKHKEPQYTCDTCGKAFHIKLSLIRHNDVEHLGIKNHVCNMCGRAFGYRKAMVKHQIRVHKREKLKLRFKNSNYKPISNN